MKAEIVANGILFGEGPVWCPDGTIVATSVAEGALYRVWPEEHRKERIAVTGGGANAAAPSADGGFLVTQNGGIDFTVHGFEAFANFPKPVWKTPSIQRVSPDNEVSILTRGESINGLNAPNDLIVSSDGIVYFTDPGHYPVGETPIGRVIALRRDGTLEVLASGFWYCNGIAIDTAGQLVVVEQQGLQRVFPDGSREWVIENLGDGGGDGFCIDTEGRFYVASTSAHGIRIVDPDGTLLDFLEIPGQGLTTNCCFGGSDGRTLFATDALPGNLVAFEHMPCPGLPIHAWPASDSRG